VSRWPLLLLGELIAEKSGSVDPSKFPDEMFDLYSIPAFDSGQPEVRAGNEIGSAKQVVQPGDVLLSRIVPHIRRSWVVGKNDGRRLIASGEWIVFRSPQINPRYLRYFLVGDPFHSRFMQTVSGVGGSLLRAKSSEVAKIQIPVPPLEEQERIVKLLAEADKLRKLRAQADRRTVDFIPALFHDMFGDPVENPEGYPIQLLEQVCTRITDGTHQPPPFAHHGIPFLFVRNIVTGSIDFDTEKFITDETFADLTRKVRPERGDILYSTVGSYGVAVQVETDRKFAFQRHIGHLKPNREQIDTGFLEAQLNTPSLKSQADQRARGIAQKTVNLAEIRKFKVLVPPLPLQDEFAKRVREIRELESKQAGSRERLDALFQSMLHRAFRGEL
jgi:type I restriction enzyme S subunit